MAFRTIVVPVFALITILLEIQICLSADISRADFPHGFTFGTASSAFQYEGAVKEDGRGPSIWDTFSHTFGKVTDFSNADVAVDHYHRYEVSHYQRYFNLCLVNDISMSFSANGSGAINQAGIDHYNKFINALLAKGSSRYLSVTISIDQFCILPLNFKKKDFATYAETCFQKFGDRVKHWITFNEPHTFTTQGYDVGLQAPGRCSILFHLFCKAGNSSTEPYIVAHNVLLTHATVADIYKKKYKNIQGGSLGVAFDVIWYEPESNTKEDIEAAQRAQDFQLGWFLDPLMFGDYPSSMRSRVGNRLPKFSPSDAALVKGSIDFIGINHYTTFYARNNSTHVIGTLLNDAIADSGTITLPFNGTKAIAERANSIWLYIVPQSMKTLMNYIKQKYGNPPVYITESGMDDPNSIFISLKDALKDEKRIRYYSGYLSYLHTAIKDDGCNVKGYFAWSLLDNWEWVAGYSSRFGLYFVDYKDNLKRYPKQSVQWFQNFLKPKPAK
ncbi:hypothetical protein RYX36_035922 [Vicia faba]